MAHNKIRDNKKPKDEIGKTTIQPLGNISFSFKYLTSNKNHSFDYFNSDMRNCYTAYEALVERMRELCCIDMDCAKARGKVSGCEPIPYKRLSSSMKSICDSVEVISKDSSLSVFRFNQNNYRLLCKTDLNHPNLLYIIGFDFNYSAYDHG